MEIRSSPGIDFLRIGGEARFRGELRDPVLPLGAAPEESEFEIRGRVSVEVRADDYLGAVVELQRSLREGGADADEGVRQGFLQVNQLWGEYELRLGRFLQDYGQGRMVSPNDWFTTSNVFDGLVFGGQYQGFDFDAFWTQAVDGQGAVNGSTDFFGIYSDWAVDPELSIDFFWFQKDDRPNAIEESTFGVRADGVAFENMEWSFEWALQSGDRGTTNLSADAWVLELVYDLEGSHHVGVEWSVASGDDDPTDGTDETFHAPFGDTHRFQGIADIVAWRNLNDVALRYWLDWNEHWTFHLDAHDFRRRSDEDALYLGAAGAPLPGTGTRRIGTELDAYVVGELGPNLGLSLGGAYFFAGSAIPNAEDELWLFGQVLVHF